MKNLTYCHWDKFKGVSALPEYLYNICKLTETVLLWDVGGKTHRDE